VFARAIDGGERDRLCADSDGVAHTPVIASVAKQSPSWAAWFFQWCGRDNDRNAGFSPSADAGCQPAKFTTKACRHHSKGTLIKTRGASANCARVSGKLCGSYGATTGQSHLVAAAIGAALPEASLAGSVRLQGRIVSQSLRMRGKGSQSRTPVAVWMAGTADRHDGFVKLRYACFSFVRQSDLAAAPALRMMPGLWLRWSNAIALAPLFQPRLDFPHFTRSGSQSLRMVLPVRHGFTPASVRCPDIENPPLSMRGPAMNARLGYECAARL
jgi:hypothetical protein